MSERDRDRERLIKAFIHMFLNISTSGISATRVGTGRQNVLLLCLYRFCSLILVIIVSTIAKL